jgi:hypothetical protein
MKFLIIKNLFSNNLRYCIHRDNELATYDPKYYCSDWPKMIRRWSVSTRFTIFFSVLFFVFASPDQTDKTKMFFQAIIGFQLLVSPPLSHFLLPHISTWSTSLAFPFAHSRAFSGLCFKPLLTFFTKLWINSFFLFSLYWSCCITTELTIVKNNLLNEVVFKFWERTIGENSLASY